MPNRTQIVCIHEGFPGHSVDPVFINRVLKDLDPLWLRPWKSNVVRFVGCGGRTQLMEHMPTELKACLKEGGDTTLIVCADIDDDLPDGNALKEKFWQEANLAHIARADFDKVVFVFAKDRIENWIEFLRTGSTDESREGPRVQNKEAAQAASKLAEICKSNDSVLLPPSLQWSCKNWRALVARMKS